MKKIQSREKQLSSLKGITLWLRHVTCDFTTDLVRLHICFYTVITKFSASQRIVWVKVYCDVKPVATKKIMRIAHPASLVKSTMNDNGSKNGGSWLCLLIKDTEIQLDHYLSLNKCPTSVWTREGHVAAHRSHGTIDVTSHQRWQARTPSWKDGSIYGFLQIICQSSDDTMWDEEREPERRKPTTRLSIYGDEGECEGRIKKIYMMAQFFAWSAVAAAVAGGWKNDKRTTPLVLWGWTESSE